MFLCAVTLSFALLCVLCALWEGADIPQPSHRPVCIRQEEDGLRVDMAGENLILHRGVRLRADSVEGRAFSPRLAGDGVTGREESRWSSANDWENNDHWLEAVFPQKTRIGCVRIFWERTNASAYSLEISDDGRTWEAVACFQEEPKETEQYILLEKPVAARHLRLHVTEVRKEEEDLSLYYQNVSVLELEVYDEPDAVLHIPKPRIEAGTGRILSVPEVPEPYTLRFGGADYENLVRKDGTIGDTLSPVEVELGFVLQRDNTEWELPGMRVEIPGSEGGLSWAGGILEGIKAAEWKGSGGKVRLPEAVCLIRKGDEENAIEPVAQLFAKELETEGRSAGLETDGNDSGGGYGIILELTGGLSDNSLGEEGYEIEILKEGTTVRGNTVQGIRWGCVTLLELIRETDGTLPAGCLRDYPRYRVRGFGIDVGRRPVSMELLRRLVEKLSENKMNTLQIHLNDNQIIAQSEYDGTMKGAMSLYAGFRLESEMRNAKGESITSEDLYYTKEEFARFVEEAKAYGVEVVPEIDTPAHSLAITRTFPEWGMRGNPESADCLDLSKEGAVQLGKDLWKEYLTPSTDGKAPAFASCTALHLGMDEYFGDSGDYLSYLQELSEYVGELAPGKRLRIWGSLSLTGGDYAGISRQLEMHIWDTSWADPADMYAEGFSVINSQSSCLYLIPGGGYDRLDLEFLEKEWRPNVFWTTKRQWELPAWSDRMLGACYMMWNDWAGLNGHEITEDGLYERFAEPLLIIAQKLW